MILDSGAEGAERRIRLDRGLVLVGCLATLAMLAQILLFGFGAYFVWEATTPVTRLSAYESTLGDLGYPTMRLAKHFPKTLPGAAAKARFCYLPKFLQGALMIELRHEVSADEARAFAARFRAEATQTRRGNDTSAPAGPDEKGTLPTTEFRNDANTGYAPLPDDFEVMVLEAENLSKGASYWNHGLSRGVAVSEKRREVIYWARYW